MKLAIKIGSSCILIFTSFILLSSFHNNRSHIRFPYKEAGLTEHQAAAHLISRLTYGATPGQVDEVVSIGLEKWFQQQLDASLPDDSLNEILSSYKNLKLTNTEVVNTFPKPGQVLRMAIKEGVIEKDSASKSDRKEYKDKIKAYMDQKGLKPEQELFREFINQKILRAAHTNNQLQEVLTDFWFNHFNVSITKNDCAQFIPAYERDIIRPNVLGKFENILLATAKSPAMLLYLDNFNSSGPNTDVNAQGNAIIQQKILANIREKMGNANFQKADIEKKLKQAKNAQGLNENYAREVMELHTLGVDGGYTQQDVTQAAKVLTGWTVYPMDDYGFGSGYKKLIEKVGEYNLTERGFVHDGDFLFAINKHDNSEKHVLGKTFPAHGGYLEGVVLLKMLAHHPSTANFISKKLAIRFVSDNPPQSLIDKMAKTFIAKDGNIKQVLITMVSSPEFWSQDVIREKTKSPFELAISTVRSLNATIKFPFQLNYWITKMGQQMYYYQAPTGFPDKGQYWINTGSLLNRMNFGLAFSSQRIQGITFNLAALNNQHEPESAEAGLLTYSKLMMPERNLDQTVQRLRPLINDPNLVKKVNEAASKTTIAQVSEDSMMEGHRKKAKQDYSLTNENHTYAIQTQSMLTNNQMLSQVVGIIIGSPEFQRK